MTKSRLPKTQKVLAEKARTKTIERIAKDVLAIDDLDARGRDELDFHDIAVWRLRDALAAAYDAGKASCSDTK